MSEDKKPLADKKQVKRKRKALPKVGNPEAPKEPEVIEAPKEPKPEKPKAKADEIRDRLVVHHHVRKA